jgi:hypothetical protein
MMTDVTVISQRLGPIAEAGKDIAKLQTLVKDKSIPRRNVSQAMAGLLKRSSSKKEVDQEESTAEPAADKDDGDEDGESLGILTKEQATDQEAQAVSDAAELEATAAAPAVDTIESANPAESATAETEAPAPSIPAKEPAVETTSPVETTNPTETTNATETIQSTEPSASDITAPSTPPKDAITVTEKLEAAEEDEPTVTETLAAPRSDEKELPVEPVSPMDQENDTPPETDGKVSDESPPALPNKDLKAEVNGDVGESPEVPAKTE